ncbi:MAG: TIGR03943 family protein [Chloroflexota bacterium]|nr:MAG: TIGR03943 family protein [Chloroflexota bacterium]
MRSTHNHHGLDRQTLLKTLILFGLGLYFIWNIASGNVVNYINTRFVWLSYVAAVLFLLLALSGAWNLLRSRRHEDAGAGDHDHRHGQMSWPVLALVAVPLVLGTLVPSRPLGADAVSGNVSLSVTGATTTDFTIPPLSRNVLDWLRVFSKVSDYDEVAGEPADVIGFVYREPDFGEDRFMVARFTVSCCVADASAIGVPVIWSGTSELQSDDWVRVQGQFVVEEFRGERVPVLKATSVELVEQPAHPYLYP